MSEPLVSVVVATYRRKKELSLALSSLASQTYPNIEVVLVDDNGDDAWNDAVSTIADAFHAQAPEIPFQRLVNRPNRGSAGARNVGIHAARGEYITFLDDDDTYLPGKVARQLQAMRNAGADYSLTDLKLYREDDKQIDQRVRTYLQNVNPEMLLTYHLMYHMTGTDTMMFRREYLLRIGGFPPIDVGDEFYLMREAIAGGGTFCYVPVCDVKAYVHEGEEGLSAGESKIAGENRLYEYKRSLFGQINKKARRYIQMRHYAVLAFAELRRRRYSAFLCNGMRSFLSSPLACVKLLLQRKGL